MGRAGRVRVGLLAAYAVGNNIADLCLAVSWSAHYACAPRQATPRSGNMFTHSLQPPALAFAIVGALSTYLIMLPATYRAIRDDEVYEVQPPLLASRLAYTFLTDLPLLALQCYFISLVGLTPNFYLVKLSMTFLSLFVSGWSLLRDVLDRYGFLWGPMREHPRFTVFLYWAVFGIALPLFLALVFPTQYPAGFVMSDITLLARKVPAESCVFPNETAANWTVYTVRVAAVHAAEAEICIRFGYHFAVERSVPAPAHRVLTSSCRRCT